jgi:hypothetical protein
MLLWVAPALALGYSRYVATAKNPPNKASMSHHQKSIREMRASARMRARLMKKIPKPVEFPHGLVAGTNSRPSQSFALLGATTALPRTYASAPEEPPLPPAEKSVAAALVEIAEPGYSERATALTAIAHPK